MTRKRWFLITIIILTLCDIAFTSWGLTIGFIEEANILWADFFKWCMPLGMLCVFCIAIGASYFLYRVQGRSFLAKYGLYLIVAAKLYILGLHLHWIWVMIRTTALN